MRGVAPEPLKDHFVVINRRRYPPKQVIEALTGLDRAEFTTHDARRIVTGLGFAAGRRSSATGQGGRKRGDGGQPSGRADRSRQRSRGVITTVRPSAADLEPFVGEWVATRGSEVLVAALDPRAVVGWLAEHGMQADSMFRVASAPLQAGGAAPS
ncbi:MAG: hypothetical protein FWD42_00355 [Solirubrobacterales bacterium]|nr:hypothetical protein [Solirubrobacterales bacterium]